jgi:hypothetical protein
MKRTIFGLSITLAICASFTACNKTEDVSGEPSCNCAVFPWPSACDKNCGLVTGLVMSIDGNKVTIAAPVAHFESAASGQQFSKPVAAMQPGTFVVNDPNLLKQLRLGQRVAATYGHQGEISVLKSLKQLSPPPAQ